MATDHLLKDCWTLPTLCSNCQICHQLTATPLSFCCQQGVRSSLLSSSWWSQQPSSCVRCLSILLVCWVNYLRNQSWLATEVPQWWASCLSSDTVKINIICSYVVDRQVHCHRSYSKCVQTQHRFASLPFVMKIRTEVDIAYLQVADHFCSAGEFLIVFFKLQ